MKKSLVQLAFKPLKLYCTFRTLGFRYPQSVTTWNESGIFYIISVEDRRGAKAVILMPPQLFEAPKTTIILALRFLARIHRNGSIFFYSPGPKPFFFSLYSSIGIYQTQSQLSLTRCFANKKTSYCINGKVHGISVWS